MRTPIRRFIIIAAVVGGLHFVALVLLSIIQVSALARLVDGAADSSVEAVLRPARITRLLTFPVMQTVGRARPVGTTAPAYVEPLIQALIPLTSVLWGVAVATLLSRGKGRSKNVEHQNAERSSAAVASDET